MSSIFTSVSAVVVFTVAVATAAPVPPCRGNEGEPGRFPTWAQSWDMQTSTIIQPCNTSGFLDPSFYSQWGIVDVDWSNAKALWVKPPMSAEELLVEQAARLKAARPGVRVMVYRNMVKALNWFTSVRNVMNDPGNAGWFMKFKPNATYHVPQCDKSYTPPKCTNLYHDVEQTPGYPSGDGNCPGPCDCGVHPCGEYLFDHRNETLANWIIDDMFMGPTGMGNVNISGFYSDDEYYNFSNYGPACSGSPVGGPTEEDTNCLVDMGVDTQEFTTTMTDAWCTTRHIMFERVRLAGGWIWQMFSLFSTPAKAQCAATLREQCAAGISSAFYNATTMHSFSGDKATLPNFAQDLATFLLLRGPFGEWELGVPRRPHVGCGLLWHISPISLSPSCSSSRL